MCFRVVNRAGSDFVEDGREVLQTLISEFPSDHPFDTPEMKYHLCSPNSPTLAAAYAEDLFWGLQKEFHRSFYGLLHCLKLFKIESESA